MTRNGKTTREILLATISEHPGITREDMLARTGLRSGVVDPARIRLWEAGLIEPDGEGGWNSALRNRIKRVGWRLVEPERQEEVRDRAHSRQRRNAKPSAEQQARLIVDALQDSTVNRLVRQMTKDGTGARRAEREAAKALRARAISRKRDASEAEREKAADSEFKRMLAHLWDARLAVGAIDSHLIRERARVANGEAQRISSTEWSTALSDVRMIIKSFGEMWQNVRDLGEQDEPCPACGLRRIGESHQIGAFAVDGEDEGIVDAEVVEAGVSDNTEGNATVGAASF